MAASSIHTLVFCDLSFLSSKKTYLWLLALLEELLLTLLLVALLAGEVLVTGDLLDLGRVDTGDVDLLGSSDHVTGVNAAKWDTVDLEWTSDEEDTLVEVLEEDDALSAEATGEEDEDGTWGEGGSWSVGTDGLADLLYSC